MKPNAPLEIRGELKPIRSSLPGCDVCELMPNAARVMDKVTVIRSVTHKYPIHGVAYATTGVPEIDVAMELSPRDGRHYPFIGSVISYLEKQKQARKPIPDNIALPWPFSSRRTGEVQRAGPYAAFLGQRYHPHFTDFQGEATAEITKTLTTTTKVFKEPYVGIRSDSRFTLGDASTLPAEITVRSIRSKEIASESVRAARKDPRSHPDRRYRSAPGDGLLDDWSQSNP